jgi:hypothetical protein
MAAVASSKRLLTRRNMAAGAPALSLRANGWRNGRLSRRQLMAWVKRRWRAGARIDGPNGEPSSRPSGTGAGVVPPQHGQWPTWRSTLVTAGRTGGSSSPS